MATKITKINMAGFRGSVTPSEIVLDPNKPVTLIFGENGTGKTTIADALDFTCNKSFGSLDNYSFGQGASAKKFVPSIGCKPASLSVSVTCGDKKWTAILAKDGPSVSPTTDCPDARILRRRTILKLIETQPKQRYEELKTFIAVPGIEASENGLRKAIDNIDRMFNEAVRALSQATEELDKLWIAEGKPENTAVKWATIESKKDVTQLQSNVIAADNVLRLLQLCDEPLAALDKVLEEQKEAEVELSTAEATLKEAEAKHAEQNANLVKLLQDAKKYIGQQEVLSSCPVCENKIDSAILITRLAERITQMQELASLMDSVTAARRQVDGKKTLSAQAQKNFCSKIKSAGTALKGSTLKEVLSLGIDWQEFDDVLLHEESDDTIELKCRSFWAIVLPCREPIQALKNAEQKSVNQHNAIAGHVDTLKKKAVDAKNYEILVSKLKKALDIVATQRKTYIEGVLAGIATEVEALYTKLHPDEGIGAIRFYLKPNTIGSLEFDARFQDVEEVPPQAYYSESHLDTLGICVFLTLSKRFKTKNTVIVLDDVLTSIDGQHLRRFMDLLHKEANLFNQVIVTTHYRPWRDMYRWAKGPAANTQLIELGPWTLTNGLQVRQFFTAVDELRAELERPKIDRQAASSKGGIVLESLLDFLTLKYRSPLPHNLTNEYTLGELAAGIDSKLGKELRVRKPLASGTGISETNLKPLIVIATGPNWIRNCVGCHFTKLGSEVSDQDVLAFANGVLALADQLICGLCGTLPTRRPSGSNWQCKCGKLELYPLVYPGADPKTVDDEN